MVWKLVWKLFKIKSGFVVFVHLIVFFSCSCEINIKEQMDIYGMFKVEESFYYKIASLKGRVWNHIADLD